MSGSEDVSGRPRPTTTAGFLRRGDIEEAADALAARPRPDSDDPIFTTGQRPWPRTGALELAGAHSAQALEATLGAVRARGQRPVQRREPRACREGGHRRSDKRGLARPTHAPALASAGSASAPSQRRPAAATSRLRTAVRPRTSPSAPARRAASEVRRPGSPRAAIAALRGAGAASARPTTARARSCCQGDRQVGHRRLRPLLRLLDAQGLRPRSCSPRPSATSSPPYRRLGRRGTAGRASCSARTAAGHGPARRVARRAPWRRPQDGRVREHDGRRRRPGARGGGGARGTTPRRCTWSLYRHDRPAARRRRAGAGREGLAGLPARSRALGGGRSGRRRAAQSVAERVNAAGGVGFRLVRRHGAREARRRRARGRPRRRGGVRQEQGRRRRGQGAEARSCTRLASTVEPAALVRQDAIAAGGRVRFDRPGSTSISSRAPRDDARGSCRAARSGGATARV